MATQVRGWFQQAEKVAKAVDRLVREKIPEDQIRVTVEDRDGRVLERIPVKQKMGALRGAAWGAGGGAVLGILLILFLSLGAFEWAGFAPMAGAVVVGFLRAAVAGAVAGLVVGGIWGMGHWQGQQELSAEALSQDYAVVTVRGEGLLERAERVLRSLDPSRVEAG